MIALCCGSLHDSATRRWRPRRARATVPRETFAIAPHQRSSMNGSTCTRESRAQRALHMLPGCPTPRGVLRVPRETSKRSSAGWATAQQNHLFGDHQALRGCTTSSTSRRARRSSHRTVLERYGCYRRAERTAAVRLMCITSWRDVPAVDWCPGGGVSRGTTARAVCTRFRHHPDGTLHARLGLSSLTGISAR